MATTKRRAETVSLEALSKSIDAAIARANKDFSGKLAKPNLSLNWEIIGRRVRGLNAADAFSLAESVAASVKLPGVDPQPTISRIGRDILVGFIARGQLPKSFGGG